MKDHNSDVLLRRENSAEGASGEAKGGDPSGLLPVSTDSRWFKGRSAPAETAMGIVQYFPDQPLVGASIGWYGEYLRAQTDMLGSLIKPGSIVMEIGTGVGAHVLALAPAIGTAGHFFLYESRILFQQVLRQNLAANGIGNVTVMKRALRGQGASLSDAASHAAGNGANEPALDAAATETIDELRLDKLDWLKIGEDCDVFAILDGASETLWRLRPKLFSAVADDDALSRIAAQLRDHGYQCRKVATALFNPGNFNRREDDIFPGRVAVGVLAMPEEIDAPAIFDECDKL